MDSLRPDRDELTLYKNRKGTKKGVKQAPGIVNEKLQADRSQAPRVEAKSRSSNGGVSGGAASRSGVSNVGSIQEREPVGGRVHQSHNASQSSAPIWGLLLVVLVMGAGFAYLYWEQSQTVKNLESRLASADEFIGQSKLLFARLEGEVSETGAGLIEAGASAEKKLAFLESEVRKLWGVSYDRNRKTLQKHEKSIEKLGNNAAIDKKLRAEQTAKLATLQKDTEKGLSILDGRLSSLSGELSITRAEQEEALDGLEQDLKSVSARTSEFKAQIETMKGEINKAMALQEDSSQNLSSIDESRRQLIKRVVDLEARLNKLSSTASPSSDNLQ